MPSAHQRDELQVFITALRPTLSATEIRELVAADGERFGTVSRSAFYRAMKAARDEPAPEPPERTPTGLIADLARLAAVASDRYAPSCSLPGFPELGAQRDAATRYLVELHRVSCELRAAGVPDDVMSETAAVLVLAHQGTSAPGVCATELAEHFTELCSSTVHEHRPAA